MPSEVSLFYAVEMSGICQESVFCFLLVLSGGESPDLKLPSSGAHVCTRILQFQDVPSHPRRGLLRLPRQRAAVAFSLDIAIGENGVTNVHDIDAVEDRWYDSKAEYVKVRTVEGKHYILRYAEKENDWTLQSGFDGEELLARPGIEFVTVEPATIRTAESKIAGCERCRNDESDIPFNFVIADVLRKHGAFEFILSEAGHCPHCRGELSEKTLVEPQGGIEVKKPLSV